MLQHKTRRGPSNQLQAAISLNVKDSWETIEGQLLTKNLQIKQIYVQNFEGPCYIITKKMMQQQIMRGPSNQLQAAIPLNVR